VKQNKVFYMNYDVGSGIEFCGDTIKPWITDFCKDNNYDFYEQKSQGQGYEQFETLIKENPTIIILNEYYDKSVESAVFYKIIYPDTKLILISHVYSEIDWAFNEDSDNNTSIHESLARIRYRKFLSECDSIFVVNKKPNNDFPKQVQHQMHNVYQPTNPQQFNVFTPWEERKDNFLYLGNLLPHKLATPFIRKLPEYNVSLDCVGSLTHANGSYQTLIKGTEKINYKGFIPQDEVGQKLNQYKYFILPHNGPEPFNMALLQAMFCGTIPLIVNICDDEKDKKWLNWASGLYFEFKTYEGLLQAMQDIELFEQQYNMKQMSKYIASESKKQFNYDRLKNMFISELAKLDKKITYN
jgi:glycosyltransferase involved in cell wall biosynthesis